MPSASPPNPSPDDRTVATQPAANLRLAIEETITVFCRDFGLAPGAVHGDCHTGNDDPEKVWQIRWIDQRLYGPIHLTDGNGQYRSRENVTADARALLNNLFNDPDRALDLSIAKIGIQLPAASTIPGFTEEESRLFNLVTDPERNQKLQVAFKGLKDILPGIKGTVIFSLSSEAPHFIVSIDGKTVTVFFGGVYDSSEKAIFDAQVERINEQRNLVNKGVAEVSAELALDYHTANIRALWW